MSYFRQSGHSKNKIEVELDLSNYAIKPGLKNATGADTSEFAEKDELTNLKVEVDKLHIVKLEKAPNVLNNLKRKVHELDADKLAQQVPPDLSKLSYVVKIDVVKKAVYDELVKKLIPLMLVNLFKKEIMMIQLLMLKVIYLILLT